MAVLSKTLTLGAALAMPLGAQAAQLVVSHFSGTIYSLEFDAEAGSLAIVDQTNEAGQRIPAWVSWDSASKTAYVSDESWFGANTGRFASYSLAEDGSLTVSGVTNTNGGDLASGLFGGEDGTSFLAQSNYNSGTLTTWALPIQQGAQALQTFTYDIDSPGPVPDRQDASHLHSAFTDPSGGFLLANDLGADLTRVWSIDSSSGSLTECPAIEAGAGDGPRHGAFAEVDGTEYLYIINELGNSVSSYTVSYASDSGCLEASLFQTISTFPSNESAPANTKAAEIHIHDGFVYASNRNDQTFGSQKDSIAQYAITASGELEFLDLANSHGYFPRTFSINEAGDYVAVGGQTDAVVAILERDVDTGLLGDMVASVSVGRKGSYMGEDGLSAVTWAE